MKDNHPIISVVIPAYNEERLLPRCLESLLKQNFQKPFEIIVVDDGSTDKTAKIAERFGVKIITLQKNKGIGNARFVGSAEIQGQIIVGTDADAVVPIDWLKQISDFFDKNPNIGAITGSFRLAKKRKSSLKIGPKLFAIIEAKIVRHLTRLIIGHYCLDGRNFAIRKNVYEQTTGFNRELRCLEDANITAKIGKISKIAYIPTLIVEVSSRRWENNFLKHLFTIIIPAIWFNLVLKKPKEKFNKWPRVDELT